MYIYPSFTPVRSDLLVEKFPEYSETNANKKIQIFFHSGKFNLIFDGLHIFLILIFLFLSPPSLSKLAKLGFCSKKLHNIFNGRKKSIFRFLRFLVFEIYLILTWVTG